LSTDLLIKGVAEDIPQNSPFHFDFIGSLVTFDQSISKEWLWPNLYTYILLKEGVDPATLDPKLIRIIEKYFACRMSISLWTFILAAVLALLIALITITFQTIRAVLANPVDSLRYE